MVSWYVSTLFLVSPGDENASLDQRVDLGMCIAVLGQNRHTVLAFRWRHRARRTILKRRQTDEIRQRNRLRHMWMAGPCDGAALGHMRLLKERRVGMQSFGHYPVLG